MQVRAKAVRSPTDYVFWVHVWGRAPPGVLIPTLLTDLAAAGNSQRASSSCSVPTMPSPEKVNIWFIVEHVLRVNLDLRDNKLITDTVHPLAAQLPCLPSTYF